MHKQYLREPCLQQSILAKEDAKFHESDAHDTLKKLVNKYNHEHNISYKFHNIQATL